MILVTSDFVSGHEIETLGLVKGAVVKSKNVVSGFFQGLKSIIGGELKGFTDMMDDSRQEATDRMVKQAEGMGADAIITIRYATSSILDGASEILVYGTAVKLHRR